MKKHEKQLNFKHILGLKMILYLILYKLRI